MQIAQANCLYEKSQLAFRHAALLLLFTELSASNGFVLPFDPWGGDFRSHDPIFYFPQFQRCLSVLTVIRSGRLTQPSIIVAHEKYPGPAHIDFLLVRTSFARGTEMQTAKFKLSKLAALRSPYDEQCTRQMLLIHRFLHRAALPVREALV